MKTSKALESTDDDGRLPEVALTTLCAVPPEGGGNFEVLDRTLRRLPTIIFLGSLVNTGLAPTRCQVKPTT